MKQIKTSIYFFVVISVLFQFSCSDTATTSETNDRDTTSVSLDTSAMPPYDPAMDAYNVGGGAIKKLGDTLGVKMYEVTSKPGESFALHTHPDHTAYVLQGGTAALFIKEIGKQDTITFPTGMGLINGPLSDSGKNIGNTTIKFLVTDIYRPRRK